ncbi:MAG: TlpA disulfide reductase family protein [Verrucomicrobiota bacterium]
MRIRVLSLGCLAMLMFASRPAVAIELGVPAPPLEISEWMKGNPVSLADGRSNQVFVVEFWATYCPPCIENIPHLTKLQKKYKDQVTIVSISGEDAPTVKKFVAKMGAKMDYTVALDKDAKTVSTYMAEFNPAPIPWAFIVDRQGLVAWSGSPLIGFDEALADIVAGKHDLEKTKRRMSARQQLNQYVQMTFQLETLGRNLEGLDRELGGIEPGKQFSAAEIRRSIQFSMAQTDYEQAVMRGVQGAELEALNRRLDELAAKNFDLAAFRETVGAQKTFRDYMATVNAQNPDQKLLAGLTAQLAANKLRDPTQLRYYAWMILNDEGNKHRDTALALKLAQQAVDVAKDGDPLVMHVYARALFESGKVAEAVKHEQLALDRAEDEAWQRQFKEALEKYKMAAK